MALDSNEMNRPYRVRNQGNMGSSNAYAMCAAVEIAYILAHRQAHEERIKKQPPRYKPLTNDEIRRLVATRIAEARSQNNSS